MNLIEMKVTTLFFHVLLVWFLWGMGQKIVVWSYEFKLLDVRHTDLTEAYLSQQPGLGFKSAEPTKLHNTSSKKQVRRKK